MALSVVWPPRDIGLAIVLMFPVLFSVEAKPAAAWRAYNDVPASDLPAQPCNPANSIPCGGVVPAEQPVMIASALCLFSM